MILLLAALFSFSSGKKVKRPMKDLNPGVPLEVNAEEEHVQQMQEWEETMKDFSPEDMITFEIPSRSEEEFFTVIDVVPTEIRGYWFLFSTSDKSMDFQITSPLNQVIFERKSAKEAIFTINVERSGLYTFTFKNNKVMTSHIVTFAYHSGNSTSAVLTSEHLSPVEKNLMLTARAVRDFQVDSQFAQLKQESHYQTVASANQNVFWFSLIESIGIVLVTAWQIYYIKNLLENRRVF